MKSEAHIQSFEAQYLRPEVQKKCKVQRPKPKVQKYICIYLVIWYYSISTFLVTVLRAAFAIQKLHQTRPRTISCFALFCGTRRALTFRFIRYDPLRPVAFTNYEISNIYFWLPTIAIEFKRRLCLLLYYRVSGGKVW